MGNHLGPKYILYSCMDPWRTYNGQPRIRLLRKKLRNQEPRAALGVLAVYWAHSEVILGSDWGSIGDI